MPRQGAAVRAPQAQLPVLHMTERRKGRMPDAPGHAPAMGSARNGNPHAGLLYPAVKCNFGKYRWTGEGLPRVTAKGQNGPSIPGRLALTRQGVSPSTGRKGTSLTAG